MNKKQAKQEAENNTRTYGDLLTIVKNTRGKREKSVLNKSLTADQALDIFERWLEKKNPEEKPVTMRYNSYKDRSLLCGDGLGVMNVLRECL